MIKIAPSILSSDLSQLAREVALLEQAGADWLHLDIMDGVFVPNLTIGPPVIKALRPKTGLPFDAHLMIVEPEKYISDYAAAGSDLITLHVEATKNLSQAIARVKKAGVKVGISLKPRTPPETIEPFLAKVDLVLVMTVEPGFGGQEFMPSMLGKIETVSRMIKNTKTRKKIDLGVDGGITDKNIGPVTARGANFIVAGSYVFKNGNIAKAIDLLRHNSHDLNQGGV